MIIISNDEYYFSEIISLSSGAASPSTVLLWLTKKC